MIIEIIQFLIIVALLGALWFFIKFDEKRFDLELKKKKSEKNYDINDRLNRIAVAYEKHLKLRLDMDKYLEKKNKEFFEKFKENCN